MRLASTSKPSNRKLKSKRSAGTAGLIITAICRLRGGCSGGGQSATPHAGTADVLYLRRQHSIAGRRGTGASLAGVALASFSAVRVPTAHGQRRRRGGAYFVHSILAISSESTLSNLLLRETYFSYETNFTCNFCFLKFTLCFNLRLNCPRTTTLPYYS